MPRYRRPPLTLVELWQEGPPVRLRDLVALSGLSRQTVLHDIDAGELSSFRRPYQTSTHRVDRQEARRWLRQLGIVPRGTVRATSPEVAKPVTD